MNYFGRELSKEEWRLVACGLKPLRPMTPEDEAAEKERVRKEVALNSYQKVVKANGECAIMEHVE